MNFKQRLLRYGLGVGIGCLLVFVLFPNYDWLGWTPGKQLMKRIRESTWVNTESGKCTMSCLNKTTADFDQARFNGEINFSMSDTHSKPPVYELEYQESTYRIAVEDTLITLIEVKKLGQPNSCNCP